MLSEKTCLLHIGRPFELGNTSIHYVEELVGVKYRFLKNLKQRFIKRKISFHRLYSFCKKKKNKAYKYFKNRKNI